MTIITDHAVQRYRERVEPCSAEDARAALMAAHRGIDAAASFGCDVVVLGNGARLRLEGDVVCTVIAPRKYR